jgi:hypothetical protein
MGVIFIKLIGMTVCINQLAIAASIAPVRLDSLFFWALMGAFIQSIKVKVAL